MGKVEEKLDRYRRYLMKASVVSLTATGLWAYNKVLDAVIGKQIDDLASDPAQSTERKLEYWFDPNQEILDQKDAASRINTEYLQKIFGYDSRHTLSLYGGADHYLFPGTMHHDTQWARDVIFAVFRRMVPAVRLDAPPEENIVDEHVVCCGSPTSNRRAGAYMEYVPIKEGEPRLGFRRINNPILNLPVTYELDTSFLKHEGLVNRTGIDGEPTPDWALRINGSLLCTKAGETDYLVISRIPNLLNAGSRSNHDNTPVALVIGGCSGAGTGAVNLLVKEGDILRELAEKTDKHPYWQAVIGTDAIGSRFHPIMQQDRFQALALRKHIVHWEPVTRS